MDVDDWMWKCVLLVACCVLLVACCLLLVACVRACARVCMQYNM